MKLTITDRFVMIGRQTTAVLTLLGVAGMTLLSVSSDRKAVQGHRGTPRGSRAPLGFQQLLQRNVCSTACQARGYHSRSSALPGAV